MAKTRPGLVKSAIGAGLAALCGLVLSLDVPLGERWVNASYDGLFRFGARGVTNKVVLILMDNEARAQYDQPRTRLWDRALHARLLKCLAADGCPLVVLDTLLRRPGDPEEDAELAAAIRSLPEVALMADAARFSFDQAGGGAPTAEGVQAVPPGEMFLEAARTNWGIAWFDKDLDLIVRRHWPFPAPGPHPSLSWTAARLAGARLSPQPHRQWLRYYGPNGAWTSLSYSLATNQVPGFFHDKIVFIGNRPHTTVEDGESDKFSTPYSRWTGETAGGVELIATEFMNLVNGDWLRRPARWVEISALVVVGAVLGAGLSLVGRLAACGIAAGSALGVALAAAWASQVTNFWCPWLVIAGGQVPCALAWALFGPRLRGSEGVVTQTTVLGPAEAQPATLPASIAAFGDLPDAPDYELFSPPFAHGAYGRVWLVRNAIGQWQALKAVYLASFGANPQAYQREFSGIQRYKPISNQHPGLLRVDFISKRKPEGYFYYVMELGDALYPGWEAKPALYSPRDVERLRRQARGQRLPLRECLRIGLGLAEALDFLHRQRLAHRDVKPQNVIFVNNQPKLADVGLVAEVLPPGADRTWVGTPGYMPPPPEPPGTPEADIYGLGMVLYVIVTGREPALFPELSTTLVAENDPKEFLPVKAIILKACHPQIAERYGSARDLAAALREAQSALDTKRE